MASNNSSNNGGRNASLLLRRILFAMIAFRAVSASPLNHPAVWTERRTPAPPDNGARGRLAGAVIARVRRGGGGVPGRGVLRDFARTIAESRRNLVAAAAARSVSIVTMYPVDTLKTRIQMGKSAGGVGLGALYKGVGGSLFGQVPYGVLTFGSYEIYKQALLDRFAGAPSALLVALAAVLGDVTGSGWLCPSEVVKQQLQAGMHADTWSAVRNIWRDRGVAGFYQGYAGGLARDVPFRVAQLTSFEVTKAAWLSRKRRRTTATTTTTSDEELDPLESAVCGAIAGTFSAAVTCPLDRVKTLLMTDGATYGGTVASCVSKIWKDEGVRGLTAGMLPRVTYIAPSVAIFFIVYEQVQQRLK